MTTLHSQGFFVLRAAVLPFDELLAWGAGLQAASSPRGDHEAALGEDLAVLRPRLRALIARAEVRDALFVASPELDDAVERWLRGTDDIKLERSLARYVARMTGRPTPFGLFAGCAAGAVGSGARLELSPHADDRVRSRLDMDYLMALVDALEADPEIRGAAAFHPNPTLYPVGGRLHYVEARTEGRRRATRLVAVDRTQELEETLRRAGDGATTAALVAELSATADVAPDEAAAFVDELIAAQVLVGELALPVIGPEPTAPLAARLRALPGGAATAKTLESASTALRAADEAPVGERRGHLRRVAAITGELGVEAAAGRLVQVDLVKAAPGARLPAAVLEELQRGIAVLRHTARRREPPELRRFRERFEDRYGDREVALAEALDAEAGIGYEREAGSAPADDDAVRWGPVEHLLLRLVAGSRPGDEAILGPDELELLGSVQPPPLPNAFAALATLAADSDAAIDRGDFEVRLLGVAGPSGAKLLGRFCHADPQLDSLVRSQLRTEEALDSDAVFAEIAHLPHGRTGNILARPALRDHEIVLVAGCAAAPESRIALGDLVLALEDGAFVLRSRRLDCRVIPCLTTAHAVWAQGIGLYRFLAQLEQQGVASGISWDWGPLAAAPYTPRVRLGRVILTPARWRVEPAELRDLVMGSPAERFANVQALRRERLLPRLVALGPWDAAVPVDLDNPLSVDLLLRGAATGGPVELAEWWPAPDRLAVHGPGGRHAHELVIGFTLDPADVPARPRVARRQAGGAIAHTLPPGSEWLYAKLYTGHATADRLLLEIVAPLVRRSVASGDSQSWHFIRYADPEHHLRLRVRGEPDRLREGVLADLERAVAGLIDDSVVWRLQIDTYQREVDRYGGAEAIELCEAAFEADSEAVIALLAHQPVGDEAARDRWRLACAGVARLLQDLGLDEGEARSLTRVLRAQMGRKLAVDGSAARRLGARFRVEREYVEPLVAAALDDEGEAGDVLLAGLRARSERLSPLSDCLARLDRAGRLTRGRDEIAASLVHMHVNRLLRWPPRAGELLVYDALDRVYEGRAARARTLR